MFTEFSGVELVHFFMLNQEKKLTQYYFAGMMRHADGSLHYYVDGVDQGAAFEGLPQYVYPVIDLYGQCAQARTHL